jgi:hypothetical protein
MADFNELDQGSAPRIDKNDRRRQSDSDRGRIISMVNQLSDKDVEDLIELLRPTTSGVLGQTGDVPLSKSDLESIDRRYGFSGEYSFSNIFSIGLQSSSKESQDSINALKLHLGARRRSSFAKATISSYTDRLSDGLASSDIVYMTNSTPCDKFNRSNSPYERVKKLWESGEFKQEIDKWNTLATEGVLDLGISTKLDFLPKGTRQRVASMFKYAYEAGVTNQGEFSREIYNNGKQIPIDKGSLNGSYSRNPSVSLAINEAEKIKAINDSFNVFEMPTSYFNLLQDTDDLSKKLDPEYASLILEYYLTNAEEAIKQIGEEYQRFKNLSTDEQTRQLENGGIFSKEAKKYITIIYSSALGVLEAYKLTEIGALGKGFTEGLGSHTPHNVAMIQGVIEILAGLYKTIYYIDHKDYTYARKQAGYTIISALAEFAPTKTLEVVASILGRTGLTGAERLLTQFLAGYGGLGVYGGYVGLGITAIQLSQEFIIKPINKSKLIELFPNVLDELLDLERRQIEKDCCTKIHPGLYRNSKGQVSILMTPEGFIPFEREYRRTVRGEGESLNKIDDVTAGPRQPGPCETNGQIPVTNSTRYLKILSSQDREFLGLPPRGFAGPPSSPVYIVDPRKSKDPCKDAIIVRPESGTGTTPPSGEGNDFGDVGTEYIKDRTTGYTPFWSPDQERNLQDATTQYNTAYSTDVFKFKIDAAKCKTGEISSVTPTGGGAPDRDGFSPLAGESGMPGGFHRVGVTRIIEISVIEDTSSSATTDSSAMNGDGGRRWTAMWEGYTRENGFSVGSGGAGTGTKLRGITSFFYDPLNPPKPIEPV